MIVRRGKPLTDRDWIDLAKIPKCLGKTLPERVERWITYARKGVYLYER